MNQSKNNTNQKYAVFGTGSSAFSFMRSFPDLNVLFFLDNNPQKQLSLYADKPVLPPSVLNEIDKTDLKIIIASEFYDEISAQLTGLGLKAGDDFLPAKKMWAEKTDFFIISYMKSGRTWLRYLIGSLIEKIFDLDNEDKLIYTDCFEYKEGAPLITSYHDDNPHRKKAQELVRTKNEYKNNKVIFMVRHPADLAVSLFYHMKYRSKQYKGDIDSFVLERIPSVVEYFNIWEENKELIDEFITVRYEDLHEQAIIEMKKINEFLKLEPLDNQVIQDVIENSSFKKMKKYEQETTSENTQLNKDLASDAKSAKVRKGKVKGYLEELKPETIKQAENYISKNLHEYFGY